ncbi:kelch-like protein 24 [Anneissia japonica]|uniref:kelch-like protein 24 n=1 Tax=Anneissia japonica TaxID=1529436 RepID=UPI00142591CF|nr:kelch-like protein 24 [Anneissia japonica]
MARANSLSPSRNSRRPSPVLSEDDSLYLFSESTHASSLIQSLQQLRTDRRFTDLVLIVDKKELHCHRCVLVSTSKYFESMFTSDMKESKEEKVLIQGATSKGLELIIDFAYCGSVNITRENVQCLLEAADFFQVLPVRKACINFLARNITPENCLDVSVYAERLASVNLTEKSWKFALDNFKEVSKKSEPLEQTFDIILKYISSDDLIVENEELVFEFIIRWVKFDEETRDNYLPKLLEQLRIHLLPPKYIGSTILAEGLVTRSDIFAKFAQIAEEHRVHNDQLLPRQYRNTRSRRIVVAVGGVGPANMKMKELKFFDPVERKWATLTELPKSGEAACSAVALGNDIYVTGIQGKTALYKIRRNKWFESSAMIQSRQRHASVALGNYVYVIGGYDGRSRLSSVERFNPKENKWEQVAPLSEALSSPAVVTFQGKIYVLGGALTGESASNKVRCYEPSTNTWTEVAPLPHALSGIAAVTVNEYIYVVGCLSQIVHRYNPKTNLWSQVESMFSTRALCAATVCNDRIYVVGGESQPNTPIDNVECYDPVSDRWTQCQSLPYPIKLLGCVTVTKRVNAISSPK